MYVLNKKLENVHATAKPMFSYDFWNYRNIGSLKEQHIDNFIKVFSYKFCNKHVPRFSDRYLQIRNIQSSSKLRCKHPI